MSKALQTLARWLWLPVTLTPSLLLACDRFGPWGLLVVAGCVGVVWGGYWLGWRSGYKRGVSNALRVSEPLPPRGSTRRQRHPESWLK